ncbi:hypothetical protein Enr13x_15900 [Stieleria neptunia]|uniref:Uncharacterized protein n=1 Tax=Stieleria neptunia TaxID=2527979 RepID=A0A518HLM8_9BACT|nr:hypothetical protein [Stieleria neptunia]QDV41747.1 hypothetical protein Enr13x_15900 [Stieleria neptunia]
MTSSAPAESSDANEIPRVAPTFQLSSRGLFAAFCVMIGVGLGVYALFPESIGGPPLPVVVTLDEAPLPTTGGQVAVLTPVVTVTSELDQPIRHLSIILNGQYEITQASPLQPGESLTLPQAIFTDKRSNRRFDPETRVVTEVMVRGQLPSKSRGVSKFFFESPSVR